MSVRLREHTQDYRVALSSKTIRLHEAVKANNEDEVYRLVKLNLVNPDTVNSRGETALKLCIDRSALLAYGKETTKCRNIAEILLTSGADPFKQDKFGNSAMSRVAGDFDKSMIQTISQFAQTKDLRKRSMIDRALAEAERDEDEI